VECILDNWSGSWVDCSDPTAVHEAKLLNLVTDKAYHRLQWQPVWDFERTIRETVAWYHEANQIAPGDSAKFQALTKGQIESYQADIFKTNKTLVKI
jgi:CDP-glucose 4,6-dehydratase